MSGIENRDTGLVRIVGPLSLAASYVAGLLFCLSNLLACAAVSAALAAATVGMLALIVLASCREILGLLALAGISLLAYLIQTRGRVRGAL